jgi:hypothetical protein
MGKQQSIYTLTKGLKFVIHEYLGAQAISCAKTTT